MWLVGLNFCFVKNSKKEWMNFNFNLEIILIQLLTSNYLKTSDGWWELNKISTLINSNYLSNDGLNFCFV